ncbi:MAG: hypothetical protein JNK60_18195, partial [Acidobacteria bacterium]|nr:hypothetical protein [Acidobacteriota bacterium]
VQRFLQQNLARRLLDGFTWKEGTYKLLDDSTVPETPSKLNVSQLILTGVSKFAPQGAVDAAVGTLVGQRIAIRPDAAFPITDIKLNDAQARLVMALEKRPRVDELATATGVPFEELTRLLYALFLVGTVCPADQLPPPAPIAPAVVSPPPPPPAAPAGVRNAPPQVPASLRRESVYGTEAGRDLPPPAAPAKPAPAWNAPPQVPASLRKEHLGAGSPSPSQAREAAIAPGATGAPAGSPSPEASRRIDGVLRDYEGFRGRDAFELLGLSDDADEKTILAQDLDRARAWAPWDLQGDPAEKASALFTAAARAYARLADHEAREALRASRKRPSPIPKASGAAFAIKTDLLDPESQHRKGSELLAAGKSQQALSFLEFAADCDPQNGSYLADAAWCRFLVAGRMTSATTLSEIEEAARIDPKSGIACFYAGELLRARGDAVRAEAYYRKAIKLMGTDRRPLDGLRELERGSPAVR